MKIGVFDSGLGGLLITHSLIQALPQYDYIYLGDTARVPYGNRSRSAVYEFTLQAVRYLFARDCGLIVIACNTASAEALRRIQREYLPAHYPHRRVLGVLIPAAEAAVEATKNHRIGLIATRSTVNSDAFVREITKLSPQCQVTPQATPLLVPLIENDALKWTPAILRDYLLPLKTARIDTLILGCTHYSHLKALIRHEVGESVTVLSQDEFVPAKLRQYLDRRPQIDRTLSRTAGRRFLTTDLTPESARLAEQLFGEPINLEPIKLPNQA